MDTDKKMPVTLAGKDFVVKQVPMARIKRLGSVVADAINSVESDITTDDGVTALMDKLLDAPHALLSLFIDDLPPEIFHDEIGGVTLPELIEAVDKAFTLNRVDALKNVFSLLGPTLLQGSISTKTS